MTFTQYSNFFSLFVFTILLIPAIILGLCGKKIRWYGVLVSIPTLCLIFGIHSKQMFQFLVFIICELILIYGYFFLHQKTKNKLIYFLTFFLSMIPLILIKVCIYIPRLNFLGFVGISYISFRIWQLIIEIHDGHIEKLPFFFTVYFITFFPTISSGPIDRYHHFMHDIYTPIASKDYRDNYLGAGFRKILWGVIYKFIIAFVINTYILERISSHITFSNTIIYMYSYTLYLFFDFAGYSFFAIGTSYLLGIKAPENFNKPFLSHNMKEFWDRWHISLSKWFGDYLFSRFILNMLRSGKIKSKKKAVRYGYLLTMTTMGLWHGLHLFYVIYGLYHGVMLILTDIYLKSKLYKNFKKKACYDIISIIVCFQIISFGMLIFSGYLFSV